MKLWIGEDETGHSPIPVPYFREKLNDAFLGIQREIARAMRELLAHQTVTIPLTDISYVVGSGQPHRLAFTLDRIQLDTARSGLEGAVLARLAQVLGEYAGRIRQCQCGTVYIAGRTDQRFHDRNCQMKMLMKERREALKRRQDALKLRRTPKKGGRKTVKSQKKS